MLKAIKYLIKASLDKIGYNITKTHRNFVIKGITYEVDPCSVGKTPQGKMTAEGAIRMIRERKLSGLKILDVCCGVGIIGLTIFSELGEKIVKEIAFSDINIFNLNSLQRTLKINHLASSHIRSYLSDGLEHIPRTEKFDIIISNPPHVFCQEDKKPLSPNRLGSYDVNWNFHKLFYRQCHNYLSEKGEVWFLEEAAEEKNLLPFIEDNTQLQYIKKIQEPLDPTFFWTITRRVESR